MKHRVIAILSLLIFSALRAGNTADFSVNRIHPEPLYIPDGASLIMSGSDKAKLIDIVDLSKDFYPIQIGAFRVKSNAEKMYHEVSEVLGKDVAIVEEDGYYKVRVSKLNVDKVREYLEPPVEETVQEAVAEPRVIIEDSVITVGTQADTVQEGRVAVPPVIELPEPAVEPIEFTPPKFFLLNSDSPWLKRINYFGKSFALVNALLITIFISFVTMIILLLVILLNRRRMEKEEDLRQYLAETYQGMIIDYLFTGSSPDKFRSIASDNYRRQALIDQMIDVSVNLKGDAEEKLCGLYLYLGLDRDSVRRAHDYRWHKKVKGFRELAFMNIKDANDVIYKALNSKNEILRMEAQIALVRLTNEDPFSFLFQLERPFSLWEQITLHELIIQHDLPVPEFKKFLKATNSSVVMFALRMIREFKQKNAEDDVRETLEHPSQVVRKLAVEVAGDMEFRSTLEVMKRMYKSQDNNTCLEIIRAMAKMPDPSLLGFLKLVLDKEDDVQLQIEATKAIENNGEEGVKTLVKLMKSEYKNYNIIVRHVLDRRIF